MLHLDHCIVVVQYTPLGVRIVVVIRSLPLRPFAKTLIADQRDGDRERVASKWN